MTRFLEKWRPREWSEVIGQSKAVALLERFEKRGQLCGRGYFITGKSGTGKTTLARIIARKVAEEWNIEELDAADLTADAIRRIQSEQSTMGMGGKNGRAFIVNEAHGLRAEQVRKLLTLTEPDDIPSYVVWIFTTTNDGEAKLFEGIDDAGPFLSRFTRVELTSHGIQKPFAQFLQRVSIAEGWGEPSLEECERLIKNTKSNLRAALNALEAGELLAEVA